MDMRQLTEFIEAEDKRLTDHYADKKSLKNEKQCLARTIKLNEEVGELCGAVLSHASLQRGKKLDEWKPENLAEEFADVMITTLLLAKCMDVDVSAALNKKIEKIKERRY